MQKSQIQFQKKEKIYNRLAEFNSRAISEYNEKTLSTLLPIAWSLSLLPLLASVFHSAMRSAIPVYILVFASYFSLFLLFRRQELKKYVLEGLYIIFTILFLFGIYLSLIHSPNMNATILLGGFAIMPLSIIDRPRRVNLFLVFWLVVHTILAFYIKPQNAVSDLVNSTCAIVLGSYLGHSMTQVRLESVETSRLLTIEKETDMLTGLFNRRKLFETLSVLETPDSEKPTGILMIDIDFFKDYNDKQGHAAGDRCLDHLGKIFHDFTQNFRLVFYRYGGEEFVAIAYGYEEKELTAVAESLRIAVHNREIDGQKISVSIGVAYCGDEQVHNYEKIIDRADKAVYAAKNTGRNKVCEYADDNLT